MARVTHASTKRLASPSFLLPRAGSDAVLDTEKLLLTGMLNHETRLQDVERKVTNLAALPASIQASCNRALSEKGLSLETRVTNLEEYFNELRSCLHELANFAHTVNFTLRDTIYDLNKHMADVWAKLGEKNEEEQKPGALAGITGYVRNYPLEVGPQTWAEETSTSRKYAYSLNTHSNANRQSFPRNPAT